MLLAAVALYVVATAAGSRSSSSGGDGDMRQGLPEALGRVLVQPAGSGDLSPSCRQSAVLTVPAGGECTFALRSGFLARRLRLRLTSADPVTAVLSQPSPKVTDTETLDAAAHPEVDLTYRQEHSTLTLRCSSKQPCTLMVR